MDPMTYLARELEKLKKAQRDKGSTPQLGTSSIENGTLLEYNAAGTLVGALGTQVDGTHTQAAFNGPTPPAPTAPSVALLNSSVRVTWDGQFANGSVAPMDLARIDVHIFAPGINPMTTPPRASIMAQGWGDISIPLIPGTYRAVLVAWTQSGMYAISPESTDFIILLITGTDISDGAISTPKLAANAVTAEKILAGAIDGMVITGATLRTAASGQRVEITSASGLRAINSAATVVTSISPSTGILTASEAVLSGQLSAMNSTGDGVKIMPDATFGGVISLYSNNIKFGNVYTDASNGFIFVRHATGGYLALGAPPDGTMLTASGTGGSGSINLMGGGSINLHTNNAGGGGNIYALPVAALTTSNAANVFVNSGSGLLAMSTSSQRYKTNIFPLDVGEDAILKAEPVKWLDIAEVKKFNTGESVETSVPARYKNGKPKMDKDGLYVMEARTILPDEPKFYSGFIAEQLHKDGLAAFVNYDEKGKPDSISYSQMVAAVVLNLRKVDRRLAALEKGNT